MLGWKDFCPGSQPDIGCRTRLDVSGRSGESLITYDLDPLTSPSFHLVRKYYLEQEATEDPAKPCC